MAQVAKLLTPVLQPSSTLLLVSWVILFLLIAISRPECSPTSLLAVYALEVAIEAFTIHSCGDMPKLQEASIYVSASAALASIAVVLAMPLRSQSLASNAISTLGTKPTNLKRSPEDNLKLWQFLSASWVWPLISIGSRQQLNNDDIWSLPLQFENRRIHQAFGLLRGTVLSRLVQANAIDLFILIITGLVQLICGKLRSLL
jgi:hypothetical protein